MTAFVVAIGFLIVYFIGRILWCDFSDSTIMGWLFFAQPSGKGSYLYGWLVHKDLFWIAMLISVVTAFIGKKKFAITNFVYFVVGMIVGILLGPTEYGTGEYGWAFWGGIYLISIPVGIVLEKFWNQETTLQSKRGKILVGVVIGSIIGMTFLCGF